ncbi:DUF932 domain-containing protein [Entomomonas sp. E2T0]|uniref:DUF932 domain-containing protein n=1 Tax=Entomomonas sp. E2T0 TaxID=2930213 RepID=UPI0022283CB8|nr:DUF932 domain-containing protein [Entomomonas sp. E2T0]UYZ84868.1 DUF932 domain-containing protein [Entomomonas sp. E2T0]
MAHLVETMAYVGKTPWHGLGSSLPSGQPIEVWADKAGMNWQINEAPVRFIAPHLDNRRGELIELDRRALETGVNAKDISGVDIELSGISAIEPQSLVSFDDQKVLYRSDSNLPLSVVSGRYKVVQPMEVLEFYRDLTEQFGFELETAGVLKQGRKFWALARTGQSSVLGGNDVVNGYVLLATSCDGSLATVVTPTTVRVVCNNTLSVAVNKSLAAESIKVPHNTVFDAAAIKRRLNLTLGQWDDFMLMMQELVKRKVSAKESEEFFMNVLNPATTFDRYAINSNNGNKEIVIDVANTTEATNSLEPSNANNHLAGVSLLDRIVRNTGKVIQAEVATIDSPIDWNKIPNGRAMKKVQTLYDGHGRGAELQAAKGTAWGLLCAMTEFIDHERQARSQENRLNSAWFGQGAQLKQQALSQALKLIA